MKPKQYAILFMAAGLVLLPLPCLSCSPDGLASNLKVDLAVTQSNIEAAAENHFLSGNDLAIGSFPQEEQNPKEPTRAIPAPSPAAVLKLPHRYLPLAAPDLIDIWQIDDTEALSGAEAGGQRGLLGQAVQGMEEGLAFSRGYIARASLQQIQLIDTESGQSQELPLPRPAGPGRDVEPLVYMPWHLGISPDGSNLLLITAEGYPDQEIDYFRLWVLDIHGHVENCLESPDLLSAGWFSDETICTIQYSAEDPSLSTGLLGFWNWKKG